MSMYPVLNLNPTSSVANADATPTQNSVQGHSLHISAPVAATEFTLILPRLNQTITSIDTVETEVYNM